jgi:hypothetical protein
MPENFLQLSAKDRVNTPASSATALFTGLKIAYRISVTTVIPKISMQPAARFILPGKAVSRSCAPSKVKKYSPPAILALNRGDTSRIRPTMAAVLMLIPSLRGLSRPVRIDWFTIAA